MVAPQGLIKVGVGVVLVMHCGGKHPTILDCTSNLTVSYSLNNLNFNMFNNITFTFDILFNYKHIMASMLSNPNDFNKKS